MLTIIHAYCCCRQSLKQPSESICCCLLHFSPITCARFRTNLHKRVSRLSLAHFNHTDPCFAVLFTFSAACIAQAHSNEQSWPAHIQLRTFPLTTMTRTGNPALSLETVQLLHQSSSSQATDFSECKSPFRCLSRFCLGAILFVAAVVQTSLCSKQTNSRHE